MNGQPAVVVVSYPGAELLDIACLTTAFDYANRAGAEPAHQTCVVSPGGLAVTCQSGLSLQTQGALEHIRGPLDTMIVSGGIGHEAAAGNPAFVAHVRRLARKTRRVASVCH